MKVRARLTIPVLTLAILLCNISAARAGWLDWLKKPRTDATPATSTAAPALTEGEMVRGLKEALSKGTQQAVASLGKEGGYLNNPEVKIPMPENLQTIEKALRTIGQGKIADDFVATMNHAAEKAVPEAVSIFGDSITHMTVEDAKGILTGPTDAATQYFHKTSETKLEEKFLPIVKDATQKTGVTSAYKNLMQQAGPLTQFLGNDTGDLDNYVTKKSLDGLFKMIADEEKAIRENPVARTTDLLQKVFGATLK